MNILGKKIILRAIEEQDLKFLHEWANDPPTQNIMGAIHFPSSMDFHKNWFNNLKEDQLNLRFAIEAPKIGLIGLSSIMKIDWKNSHAWHGVMLGNVDIRGKGYGFDAVMTTMKYAFDEMNLNRLDGSMIEYNKNSINFYCEKLGWKKEGIRRRYFYRRGKYWDQVIVGITKKDYVAFIEKNKYWEK